MDRDPYRGEKQLDAKLEKLAAAGRERIAEAASEESAAASKRESAGDRNVRAALGGNYGTPLRTFLTALLVTCIVTALTGIVLGIAHASLPRDAPLAILAAHAERIGALFGLSVLATPIALVARLIVTPLASPARAR